MMKSEFASARSFIRGAARFGDLMCVLSKGRALGDMPHTSVVALDQGNWAGVEDVAWNATAIAAAKVPADRLVVVGEEGEVLTYVGGESTIEKISPAPKLIRNAATIDGKPYACGMHRQVFRRTGPDEWVDLSAPRPAAGVEAGFEAIAGYSENEVYAVGWSGEIWWFDGSRWTQGERLTDRVLTSVCCAPNGEVYVGGQEGVLIRGRRDQWKVVEWAEPVDLPIWDLRWFDDRLYLATPNGLFTLDDDTLVYVDVDPANESAPSFYSLTASEGVLWAIGDEDIYSYDGTSWTRYE